jgi:hypothetical protein
VVDEYALVAHNFPVINSRRDLTMKKLLELWKNSKKASAANCGPR